MFPALKKAVPEFDAYRVGVMMASVCSSLPLDATGRRLNAERPTGIPSPWQPSGDAAFRSGEPNPCPCERNPETHKHYLFEC